ncbi:unnamed protein product, partial [Staurois parvus]
MSCQSATGYQCPCFFITSCLGLRLSSCCRTTSSNMPLQVIAVT